jgi:hypothetical protein
VPGPASDFTEEPVEAQDAGPENRPALGQLALRVLHIAEGGDDEDGLLAEAGTQPAEHLARLGGVGGAGYKG